MNLESFPPKLSGPRKKRIKPGGQYYRLNIKNGGFPSDKSEGPKAPRDLSGVKPTYEVFNRLITRSRRFC